MACTQHKLPPRTQDQLFNIRRKAGPNTTSEEYISAMCLAVTVFFCMRQVQEGMSAGITSSSEAFPVGHATKAETSAVKIE